MLTATRLFAILALSLATVLALSFSFFAGPHADDFCRMALPTGPGAWLDYAVQQYMTWNGRWATMSIYGLFFPYLGAGFYKILTLASLPLFGLAFWLVIRATNFDRSDGRAIAWLYSGLLVVVYWAYMRDPGETWYWATGFVEYQIPFLLSIAVGFLVLESWKLSDDLRVLAALLLTAAVLSIICTGMNELTGLYVVGIAVLSLIMAAILRDIRMIVASLVLLLIAAAGLHFTMSAPGVEIRVAQDFSNSGRPLYVMRGVLSSFDHSVMAWLVNPALWAIVILLATDRNALEAFDKIISGLEARTGLGRLPLFLIVPLLCCFAIFLGRLAISIGQAAPLPSRISNLLFAYFIAGFVICMPFVVPRVAAFLSRTGLATASIRAAAFAVLGLAVLSSPNVAAALNQLPQTVLWWLPEMDARIETIDQATASGGGDVVLERLRFRPQIVSAQEFSANPENWVNRCAAAFYGVSSIRVD